jgi:hypothetical protein
MDHMSITSVASYLTFVEEMGELQMYRGQGNVEWPAIPSLARKVNEFRGCGGHFNSWSDVEDHLIEEFRRLSAPWLTFVPQDRFEWLVLAQHHGLPTVLLDMTTNPLKALFFAVENPEHDGFDGVVFGFEPWEWYTSTSSIKEVKELTCFYPKHINPRLVSQESCFVAFNFPDKLDSFPPLTVYDESNEDSGGCLFQALIQKEVKPKLRKELSKMGVTHQTMFPGLDGISITIRRTLGWK